MGFSRVKVYEDDTKWAWKFILRVLAIPFDITGISLTAWALAESNAASSYEGHEYYYSDDFFLIPWNIITVSSLPN